MRPPPMTWRSGARTRPRATVATLFFSAQVLATPGVAACDRYEPRCTVGDPVVEIEAPARAVLRLIEERDGRVLVSWIEVEAGDGGPPTLLRAARAVLDPGATSPAAVERIDLPARLAGRRGSTSASGVEWLPGFTLVRWIETSVSTDPDGTPRTHAAAIFAVRAAGRETVLEPAEARCDDCSMTMSSARAGDEAIVVVNTSPAPAVGGLGDATPRPGSARVLRFTRDGALDVNRALDAAPASVVEEAGDVFLLGARASLVVDRDLARRAGPFPPLTAGSFVRWDGGEAAIATPRPQTRSGGEPDVMLSRLDARGATVSGPLRFTHGAQVGGLARLGRGHVAVVRSSDGLFGAEIDDAGRKVGADFPIRGPAASGGLVLARGNGERNLALHAVAGSRVTRQDISCAP